MAGGICSTWTRALLRLTPSEYLKKRGDKMSQRTPSGRGGRRNRGRRTHGEGPRGRPVKQREFCWSEELPAGDDVGPQGNEKRDHDGETDLWDAQT